MRYRDQPTVEVTQRVRCDVATAWGFVSDITLPVHCSAELHSVEWLDGAEGVAVVVEARHMCMLMRGVEKQNASMVTSTQLGLFRESESARNQFLRFLPQAV